jgi:phage host-nuclease inhibitor protein Gam
MANWKEGDRVRVKTRPVTDEDRKKNRYFAHMAGLTGTIQNIYGADEIAVKMEIESLTPTSQEVHKTSTQRMREKFLSNISEEQKKQLTQEELDFEAHYMLLLEGSDLEKVS